MEESAPKRKSKPRTEEELLKYAKTPAGAKRIKRAYRALKRGGMAP
jgi:hypothetical protein